MTPDTGPGLSGFLAHLVWAAYRHFPCPGTYDWMVLYAAAAAAVYGVSLPFIWKSVRADMRLLQARQPGESHQLLPAFWALGWMYFLIWFFGTPAGHTFLAGRALPGGRRPGEVDRSTFWFVLVVSVVVVYGLVAAGAAASARLKAGGLPAAGPFPRRTLACLYAGGGILVDRRKGETVTPVASFVSCLMLTHLFYWFWSGTAEMLMAFFLAAALLAEVARMGFVYVWHKRTFG